MSLPTRNSPSAHPADDAGQQRASVRNSARDTQRDAQRSAQREERAERKAQRRKFVDALPLTARGMGVLLAGVMCLVLASVLGRRELMAISIFLIAVPLVSVATVYVGRRKLEIHRGFLPHPITAGQTTRVTSRVIFPSTRGASVQVEEQLPTSFGTNPRFVATPKDSAGFSYRLRPTQRGSHTVGPATALMTDVLGLAKQRVTFGEASALCVLPRSDLFDSESSSGAHFGNGIAPTKRYSSPDTDDVMTREYREGDPLRRIHWPASARHGELMVRQEVFSVRYYMAIMIDAAQSSYATDATGAIVPELSVPRFNAESGVTTEMFNHAVELAATLVEQMHGQGVSVDVFDHSGLTLNEGMHSARGYVPKMGPDSVQWTLSELGLNTHSVGDINHDLPIPENQTIVLITNNPTTEHAQRFITWLEHHRSVHVVLYAKSPAIEVFEEAGWTVHHINTSAEPS